MTGNNKFGAAGRGGVPASTLVAFLDAYTYVGRNPEASQLIHKGIVLPDSGIAKRINGTPIPASVQRSIRRWRNGQVDHVSVRGLAHVLDTFGFTLAWFHQWCKLHRKPIK